MAAWWGRMEIADVGWQRRSVAESWASEMLLEKLNLSPALDM